MRARAKTCPKRRGRQVSTVTRTPRLPSPSSPPPQPAKGACALDVLDFACLGGPVREGAGCPSVRQFAGPLIVMMDEGGTVASRCVAALAGIRSPARSVSTHIRSVTMSKG